MLFNWQFVWWGWKDRQYWFHHYKYGFSSNPFIKIFDGYQFGIFEFRIFENGFLRLNKKGAK